MKLTARLATTAAAIGMIAAAPTALAAEPESGTISNTKPKVAWSGQLFNAWPTFNVWFLDPTTPCVDSSQCDQFDLKVADAGDITLTAGSDADYGDGTKPAVAIRVETPDGEIVYGEGEGSPDAPFAMNIDGAQAGDYVVHITEATASFGTEGINYAASAELASAPAPEAPKAEAPKAATPPSEAPKNDSPAPAPAPAQEQRADSSASTAFTLTAKAPKLSARKVKKAKSFSIAVTTSRAIQGLTASLKQGKKTVGTGKVAAFSGNGAIKLRVAKGLKAGTYTLLLTGTDNGVTVARTLKLKVSR